jgi:protein TonB
MNAICVTVGILLATLIAAPARSQEQSAPPATAPAAPPTSPTKEKNPPRIRVPGDVAEKNLIHRVLSAYPSRAFDQHITGTVLMRVIIAQDGSVLKVSYISGPKMLKDAAMDAVIEWKYKPALVNGQPVEVDTTVKMVFSL